MNSSQIFHLKFLFVKTPYFYKENRIRVIFNNNCLFTHNNRKSTTVNWYSQTVNLFSLVESEPKLYAQTEWYKNKQVFLLPNDLATDLKIPSRFHDEIEYLTKISPMLFKQETLFIQTPDFQPRYYRCKEISPEIVVKL